MKRTAIFAGSLLVLVAILVVPASSMQRGRGGAPQTFTNLQVLPEGAPVIMIMRNIRDALGVECAYCHVEDRASDDIDKKVIARGMMRMVQAINRSKSCCMRYFSSSRALAERPSGMSPA